jgi:hypothetical protein
MNQLLDSPFWYFQKNKDDTFSLQLRGLISTPITTHVHRSQITRLKAEFCSDLEIELMHCLGQRAVSLNDITHSHKETKPYQYMAEVLASMRYETPKMLAAKNHFQHLVLGELELGDIVNIDLEETSIDMFITGIFDDSLQAVILNNTGKSQFKPYQSLFIKDL